MSEQLAFFAAETERDRILKSLASNHEAYIGTLRSFARLIAIERGTVTIDDVRGHLAATGFPMPDEIGADFRVFGCVLRCADFEAIGQRLSARPERVARSGRGASYVTTYRLRERAA